jgi:DNA repair protein RadC
MIEIKDYSTDVLQWADQVNEIVPVYKTRPFRTTKDLPKIERDTDAVRMAYAHFSNLLIGEVEYFGVFFLNKGQKVIGFQLISQGGISGTVADPRVIMKAALLVGATGLILVHNHPSGNLKPSHADSEITIKIREGCRFFDIQLIDHLILSGTDTDGTQFYSFAQNGII